ncbi:hypothetical protein H6G95_07135 [Nostoc linckia FACHB-391]|uniref:Uncharacterized protein n=1 Tax=Nostoc linckia FACHB-391 TaxID=2692906 RepID=A0ABR8ER22_NOSLI|nr:hypothetical protein [Nostoc linckia FACHB-391]
MAGLHTHVPPRSTALGQGLLPQLRAKRPSASSVVKVRSGLRLISIPCISQAFQERELPKYPECVTLSPNRLWLTSLLQDALHLTTLLFN